jgi:nicotinamide mononucleotide transporter
VVEFEAVETPMRRRRLWAYGFAGASSAALVALAASNTTSISLVETLGFVTGAWCVWLTVLENIWNWPIGIANSAFYLVVFLSVRLYADMGLQVVYIVLGVLGWYWWLRGGRDHGRLTVRRVGALEASLLAVGVAAGTIVLTGYLRSVGDSAPLLDAFTTCLSLGAQYLLSRKLLQNWYLWIAADLIYIGLYSWRGLYLTAVLYVAYATMCVLGLRAWRRAVLADA